MDATGTNSSRVATIPNLGLESVLIKWQRFRRFSKSAAAAEGRVYRYGREHLRSIWSHVLLEPLRYLRTVPLLKLEVLCKVSTSTPARTPDTHTTMCRLAPLLPLNQQKYNSSYNWNKVQWQIHYISNERLWRKFLKW